MDNAFAIECLKNEIELKFGRNLISPTDFKYLSLQIQLECKEQLSPHTLMRIWGYLATSSKPSPHTLAVLCRFIGYQGFTEFIRDLQSKKTAGSSFIETDILAADMLKPGDHISLEWKPNRCITLIYLGNYKFRVISNQNSRLEVGEELQCVSFAKGIPFVASMRKNKNSNEGKNISYIGGKDSGLTSISFSRQSDYANPS